MRSKPLRSRIISSPRQNSISSAALAGFQSHHGPLPRARVLEIARRQGPLLPDALEHRLEVPPYLSPQPRYQAFLGS